MDSPSLEHPADSGGGAIRPTLPGVAPVRLVRTVAIHRPAAELYAFWKDPARVPEIIRDSVSIMRVSSTRWHWTAGNPPGGRTIEWDTLIVKDEPGRLIAWETADPSDVPHSGSIRFAPAPGDQGTEVTVTLEYEPPGRRLDAELAKLGCVEATQRVAEALRRFKGLMETGEIPPAVPHPIA